MPCRVGRGIISWSSDAPSGYPDERVDSALLTLFERRPLCTPEPRRANKLLRLRPELTDAEWTEAVRTDVVWTDAECAEAEYIDADSEDVGGVISFPKPEGPWPPDAERGAGVTREALAEDGGCCAGTSVSEACACEQKVGDDDIGNDTRDAGTRG